MPTSLDIRLAEPVVFLRGLGDAATRRRNAAPVETAPAMVRGILTLKLAKATKIRSIGITLEGKAKTEWPEGIGARRAEVTEDVSVLSSSTVFFRAGHATDEAPTTSARRAMSLGPGVALDHEADDEGALSDDEDDDDDDGVVVRRPIDREQGTIRAPRGRRLSADQNFFQRHIVEHNDHTSVPTPPYTPRIESRQSSVPGSPSQTLHELRGALRTDITAARTPAPSRPASIHASTGSQPTSTPLHPTAPHEILSAPPSQIPSTNVSSDASVRSFQANISEHPSDEEDDDLEALRRPSPSRRQSSVSFLDNGEMHDGTGEALHSPPLTERQRSVSRSTVSQPPAVRSGPQAGPSSNPPRPILQASMPNSLRGNSSPSPHPSSLHPAFRTHDSNHSEFSPARPGALESPHAESPARDRDRSESRVRGRQTTRFSLSAVSNVLHELGHEITDRVRSKSRASAGPTAAVAGTGGMVKTFGRGGAGSGGPGRSTERGRDPVAERQKERASGGVGGMDESPRGRQKERTALEKIGASLGLDVEPDGEGDMWQEFRKGTYNYPISFAIPSTTPPTLHCDFGSITYRLKAVVHRTGTFVPKLVAQAEVTLISCPGEDDTEDRENIVVERQWDEQLRYFITISGKSFPVGGTVPITLVMMPLAKIKIYRITVLLEEKIDYYAHGRRVARHDPTRRYELLSLKYPNSKHEKGTRQPLLPLLDDSPDAMARSPLVGLIESEDGGAVEGGEGAVGLFNINGPWTLQFQANLPTCSSPIHFTCKHAKSNIIVSHWIKIMIRVDRGDESQMEKGKKKQFDIIVETPVHILSCKCNPDYTSLPPYTFSSQSQKSTTAAPPGGCLCDHAKAEHQNRLHSPTPPLMATQSPIAGLGYSAFNMPAGDFGHVPLRKTSSNHAVPDRMMGGLGVDHVHKATGSHAGASGSGSGAGGERPQVGRAAESAERITTLVDRSLQFARLVSGEEGVAGDVPPAYEDAVEGGASGSGSGGVSTSVVGVGGEERGRVAFSPLGGSRAGSRSRPQSRSRGESRPGSRPASRPASRTVSRSTSMVWS